jgi:hypothetical protein
VVAGRNYEQPATSGFNVGERFTGLNGHLSLECVIFVDEGATIGYGARTNNSRCTNKFEILIIVQVTTGISLSGSAFLAAPQKPSQSPYTTARDPKYA